MCNTEQLTVFKVLHTLFFSCYTVTLKKGKVGGIKRKKENRRRRVGKCVTLYLSQKARPKASNHRTGLRESRLYLQWQFLLHRFRLCRLSSVFQGLDVVVLILSLAIVFYPAFAVLLTTGDCCRIQTPSSIQTNVEERDGYRLYSSIHTQRTQSKSFEP